MYTAYNTSMEMTSFTKMDILAKNGASFFFSGAKTSSLMIIVSIWDIIIVSTFSIVFVTSLVLVI